jgi:hypothetical protein
MVLDLAQGDAILLELILLIGCGLGFGFLGFIILRFALYPAFMYLTFDNLPKKASRRLDGHMLSQRAKVILADSEVAKKMMMDIAKNKHDIGKRGVLSVTLKDWQKKRISDYEKGLCYINGKPTFRGLIKNKKQ